MQIRPLGSTPMPAPPVAKAPEAPPDRVTLGAAPPDLGKVFDDRPRPAAVVWSHRIDDIRQDPDKPPTSSYRFLPPRPVSAPDGRVYVGTHRGELMAWSPEGDLLWSHDLGRAACYNEPTVALDGTLTLTNGRDGRLLRLDPQGQVLVDTQIPEPAMTRPQVDREGRVAVGGRKGVHGLRADGTLAWSRPNERDYVELMSRDDDTLLALHIAADPSVPGCVTSLDHEGNLLWRRDFAETPRAMPATGPGGGTLLGEGPHLHSLDPHGQPVYTWTGPAEVREIVTLPDGDTLASCADGTLARVAPDGAPRWTSKLPGPLGSGTSLGPDGQILGLAGTRLVSVTPEGQVTWNRPLDTEGRPTLRVAGDGTCYVETAHGTVRVYDRHGLPAGTLTLEATSLPDHPMPNGRLPVTDHDRVHVIRPLGAVEDPRRREPAGPAGEIRRVGDWIEVGGVRLPVHRPDR